MSDETRKIITSGPENSETPLNDGGAWITPNDLFFVRNHFDIPKADASSWQLELTGLVDKPYTLSLDELKKMPQRSVMTTVECAGNGRSFLARKVHGVQWGAGAVGHAEWTGVPLRDVLDRAGVKKSVVQIICEGADCGSEEDHPEKMHFARGLPIEKAMHADTILALRMNGEPLPEIHGRPIRLMVPGWYGVASVKWLRKLEATDKPFEGYFQTKKYTYKHPIADGYEKRIVGPMPIKSEILRPSAGQQLGLGANRIAGVAWAGEQEVAAVEVSTDGGRTWGDAQLVGLNAPYCWRQWEYLWECPEPGTHILMARARSTSGETQPSRHDLNRGGYMINFTRQIPVMVNARSTSDDQLGDEDALTYDMDLFARTNAATNLDFDMPFEFVDGAGI